MSNSWNANRAKERIETRFEEVREVSIVDYTKDLSLANIPVKKAYRMDAAHLYVDILNVDELLGTTDSEGPTCHKRVLKFLNLHYRAVHRILSETDARRVDFHNQRLHGVVAKPYGDDNERKRVVRAVAIADLITQVLKETGDADDSIPNAKVRVGIDTGHALVVNNGRRGGRESMFLGRPANHAAKCASAGSSTGIYLTNQARKAIGLSELKDDSDRKTALTNEEITACNTEAALSVSKDEIVEAWKKEQEETPLGSIEFSRPAPPLRDLDFQALTAANSKRFDGVSVYADIDKFTAYVDAHIDDNAEDVVRTLHVLRSEFDQVVTKDFDGRRVRFVGDCIHGLLYSGTAHTTDTDDTLSRAVLCCGALRSSFAEALKYLDEQGVDVDDLGLAIGFDFGWVSASRLGMKGSRVRCAIGRNVLESEVEQQRCNGKQTAIGQAAYKKANDAIQELFTSSRRIANLDYAAAVNALAESGDKAASASFARVYEMAKPAVVPALAAPLRPYSE
ncbi:MAG: adenylate/guanylate cyclase domain-containing protein [Dokdonella sp.]